MSFVELDPFFYLHTLSMFIKGLIVFLDLLVRTSLSLVPVDPRLLVLVYLPG